MIFIVATIHDVNDVIIRQKISATFKEGDYYEIGRGQWLISFAGTAKELYQKLSPLPKEVVSPPEGAQPPGQVLSGTIVLGVAGYFGVASRDMWEWMAVRLGGKVG
jgi:hypothetical protein